MRSTLARRVVELVPINVYVVDRDDPKKKWADKKTWDSGKPIYAGEKNGDMVSWKLEGTDSWTNTTFTWTATGPNGQTVTGPTGAGKNEWKIADGDDDTANDWVKWDPGKWKIKVQIGASSSEFEQVVGARTTDVVAIGWINPAGVPLDTSGVDSDVLQYYPSSGTITYTTQKIATACM